MTSKYNNNILLELRYYIMVKFTELFENHQNMMRREFMSYISLHDMHKFLLLNKRMYRILHPDNDLNDNMYLSYLFELLIKKSSLNVPTEIDKYIKGIKIDQDLFEHIKQRMESIGFRKLKINKVFSYNED